MLARQARGALLRSSGACCAAGPARRAALAPARQASTAGDRRATSDVLGLSMVLRAENVFVTASDCTPLFYLLADKRFEMNNPSARVFGELLAATTNAAHLTGGEIIRASVVGRGPLEKAWVFWQDRGATGYVKNPRFDAQLAGTPELAMGEGTLSVLHPKLSEHRLQVAFRGDVSAAWEEFYARHFDVPSLVRVHASRDEGNDAQFCAGITVHVFEPALPSAADRKAKQGEQLGALREQLDAVARSGLQREGLWTEAGLRGLLKAATGLTRAQTQDFSVHPVKHFCGCGPESVLVERIAKAPQMRREIWDLMQHDQFNMGCRKCGTVYAYTPASVRAAAPKAKQSRIRASVDAMRDQQAASLLRDATGRAVDDLARELTIDRPLSFEDILGPRGAAKARATLPSRNMDFDPERSEQR